MVQCEMCGAETSVPKTIKVEGAELDVCGECTDFGTTIEDDTEGETSSTKYSTDASSGDSTDTSAGGTTRSTGGGGGGSSGGRRDMFDDVDELATDYDDRIRSARESRGLSQSDLAAELNEKASLIRKLERGETLPSDAVQAKLERFLDVSLTGEIEVSEEDWDSDSGAAGTTLGDVVQRKD